MDQILKMQDSIHKKLFLIAEEFFKLKPWEFLEDCDIFGLFLKDKSELYFASVMGSGGMEFGALFMKGWQGFKMLADSANAEEDKDIMINRSHLLSVSLSRKDDLHPDFIRYHKRYAPHINSNQFPCFMAKEPLKVFKPPQDNEAHILYLCIRAIIELINKNLLDPENFKKGNRIKIFEVSQEGTNIHIIPRYKNIVSPKPKSTTLEINEEILRQLKALPKLQTIYNIAAPAGIVAVKDKMPRIFFIHDEVKEFILAGQALYEENLEKEAFDILKDTFLGKNFLKQKGLPQEVRTDSKYLYDYFKQILSSLGIRIICVESIPKIKEIIETMLLSFNSGKVESY